MRRQVTTQSVGLMMLLHRNLDYYVLITDLFNLALVYSLIESVLTTLGSLRMNDRGMAGGAAFERL
jgi:hypothetical protein